MPPKNTRLRYRWGEHPELAHIRLGGWDGSPIPVPTVKDTGDVSAAPCPDCRGTGSYAGLATVETCRTCGGTG